ncbi:uncharacterized protein LOC128236580 isoform X2 [Mya arenaria]|uniref:uncharacterized protein LOC128236580 isoform X2 n=1 Tax=Mya arenaria TaxID=6604 RepID=UPI0022DF6C9C|nr:uncharacterized protein LOC128236580 isoform X2 [Mya arenaria]
MSKLIDTNNPASQNWLKQWRAVYVTRQALLPAVEVEATLLHGEQLRKAQVPACTTCSSIDVHNRNARCPFHTVLREELVNEHAYGQAKGIGALNLRNTKTENWAHSPWEIAKVFMSPSGYEKKATVEETDFNGIAGFIINCRRFQGKITPSVCEKAREMVNHIRHMPDSCSSSLTDQATTECIDNLYALLKEPGLQARPEALQARKQLDQLKTTDPSKDENAYKYICQELHDEFQQRLADIEMKLQTDTIDTESAKEYIHSESKQFQKNLEDMLEAHELFSNAAMHDLSETKDNIFLSIKQERSRVMDHITFLERRATENIKQAVTDGKRTLEDQSEILVKRLRKEVVEPLHKQTKSELKENLLNHYKTKVRMQVRLDIDAAVEDIYEMPLLVLKNKKDKDGKYKHEKISDINNMFLIDKGTLATTVFVEGEPGTGKSSLCRKIVADWCELNQKGTKEAGTYTLFNQIEFLFYIKLREVEGKCKVKDMILQCLIDQIESDDKGFTELLTEILKSERCLILLDGLDEWKHSRKCKLDERIPHIETNWMNCTTIITTRPYKLAEVKVNLSQLGNHVQLQGVESPKELVRKIIWELRKSHQVAGDTDTCVNEIQMKGLWHFRDVPIMLVHIVWLWHRGKLKENMSQCFVYREIIEERWYEMWDKKNIKANKPPNDFLYALGELAFHQLISPSEDDSIVFEIQGDQLEKFRRYEQSSLESGIISCSNRAGERSPYYHFLHKTLQEYLSAWYLANCGTELSKMCKHIEELYVHNRRESVFSLSQMFLSLCSLNKTAAEMFSKTLNDLFTENCERDDYSADKALEFQNMILRGYDEAEKSGHSRMELEFCLNHVVLGNVEFWKGEHDLTTKQKSTLKDCLEKRKSNLMSLHIGEKSTLSSALQYKKDPNILDLAACKTLKFVDLTNDSYEDINHLNLHGLLECNISFIDYQTASKLASSLQSSDLKCLRKLTLNNFGFERQAGEIISQLENIKHIDLTLIKACRPNDSVLDLENLRHLEYLEKLSLRGLDFSDVINLQVINLHKLGIKFRTQQRAPQLITALLPQRDGSLTTALPSQSAETGEDIH